MKERLVLDIPLLNSKETIPMEFCWIPPGWFRIGQRGVFEREEPPTWAQVASGFWMGKYPVTRRQSDALGGVAGPPEDERIPIRHVSWRQAAGLLDDFKHRLSDTLAEYKLEARLPTEVEWEYACRAGTDTEYVFGDGIGALRERQMVNGAEQSWEMVCFDKNSLYKPRIIDASLPNPFGLHEMHGSVYEWCQDRFDGSLFRRAINGITVAGALTLSDRYGNRGDASEFGEYRTLRGGSYFGPAWGCRAAYRDRLRAGNSDWDIGLRVCLVPWPDVRPAVRREEVPADASQADQRRRQAEAGKAGREEVGIEPGATAQPELEKISDLEMPSMEAAEDAALHRRVLETMDGKTWTSDLGNVDAADVWKRSDHLTKLVIGAPPVENEPRKAISVELPNDLAKLFPNLTHLYLWQIESLQTLPRLPANLQVIDLRGCRNLQDWGDQDNCKSWGATLEELFVDDTRLAGPCWQETLSFSQLIELSIRGCANWPCLTLRKLLRRSPKLRYLDASDCPQIEELESLPDSLRVLKLNSCPNLQLLPPSFPTPLRRLELRGANLKRIPAIHSRLDYVDLSEMKSLKRFPHFETVKPNLAQSDYVVPEVGVAGSVVQGTNQQRLEWPNEDWVVQPLTWRPRTLYLHGSGIVCDSHLKGEAADTNVSDRVFAYLSEAPFVPDRELKVILLGNGRSGKSSFANALKNQLFSKEEATTHGIKLWTIEDFPLLPTDDEDHSEGSKSVRLNIWDFAGQDLYHGTHRLFLQEKAIYIVCHSNPEYPGADEETDVFEKVAAESEKRITGAGDRPRRPVYWYQMIRSLLGSDRTEVRPQILFLHTKTDRAEEHSYLEDPPAGYSWHTFSAPGYVVAMQLRQKLDQGVSLDIALGQIAIEPGIRVQIAQVNDPKSWIEDQLENMELIKRWIQQQASRLLGNTESHQIPESAMKVKEAIRLKILENSAAYEKHENDRFNGTPYRKWGKATETLQYQSPHPKISRKEFDDLVAKHCGRWYMNRPELLLDWFHQSGFIYYDPKNLPNDILIDQRWAIHGIYTLFDRSGTPNLMDEVRRSGGQIPISALISRWEKHTTAYAAEDQKLFLQFMISCGMAYVVLTEEESLLNQKILAFPSLFPDKAEVWKVHKNRSVLRERFNIEIPDCSESEVRTVLARLGQRWSRRMEPYRWGCCRISPLVERSEFQLDWLEDPAESDCYVFPLHLSFLGEKDGVTESFVQETLFGVLGQSRGLTQEQLLATWPAEQRSEVQEGVLPKEVERNLQVGIAIAVSYAGPNRTRRSPSRILEDENYWLGEVPKRLCLKIRDAVRNGKQSAQGESIPGVSEIYFYDADDREERPEAMVASLTKGDLFIAFVSRKYLHSPYCMVEIYEVFRNNNRSLPNGKVLIIDVMLGGNAAVGGNFRRQRFRVSEWCQYWNRKWKVWFKVADYVATKKLSRKFKTASARTSKDQQAMEILSDPNLTFEIEKIRSAFLEEQHRSYSAWKDAIRVEQTKPILADLGSHIRENSVAISIDIPSGIFDFNDVEACNIIGGQVNIAFEAVKRLCEKAACGWSGFPQIPRR